MLRTVLGISLGAIAGALSRYYLTQLFTYLFGKGFPYGTFFINISGCLLMGFLFTLFANQWSWISGDVRLMLTTGFLGAYTTFSTYGLESFVLFSNERFLTGILYVFGSVFLGILAVKFGSMLARLIG